jgi:transcriptional regulator with XRE-family HTH domain
MMSENFEEMHIGEKIKQLREDQALSLEDLAKRVGVSPSVLNQIENHLVSPPLGTLIKIAHALSISWSDFFGGEGGTVSLVRKDERKKVSRFASKDGVNYGYSYESLGFDKKDRQMEPFLVTLEKTEMEAKALSSHPGEEFIFVLEGKVLVQLGDHTDILLSGDSIYYDANILHHVGCQEGERSKILAVLWAPKE